MAKYSTTFDESQADTLLALSKTLDGFEKRLNTAASRLDVRDDTMSRLANAVRSDAKAVPELAVRVKAAGNALSYAIDEYQRAENDSKTALEGVTSLVVKQPAKDTRSWLEKLGDDIYNVGKKVVTGVQDTFTWFQKEMQPGGVLYKPFHIAKAVVDIGLGALMVAISTGVIPITGGVATPFAVLGAIYGVDKFANGLHDLYTLGTTDDLEQLEKVLSTNPLEVGLVYAGSGIGYALGGVEGEKYGAFAATAVYFVGDVVSGYGVSKFADGLASAAKAANVGSKAIGGVDTTSALVTGYKVLDKVSDVLDDIETLADDGVEEFLKDKIVDNIFEGEEDLFSELTKETLKEIKANGSS